MPASEALGMSGRMSRADENNIVLMCPRPFQQRKAERRNRIVI
jgi:hypothetical protein